MKKQFLLFIMFLASFGIYEAQAQDTIRSLIFSEWRGAQMQDAYFELTNVGTETVDLSNFMVCNVNAHAQTFVEVDGQIKCSMTSPYKLRLSGMLGAGESLVFMNVMDAVINGQPLHRLKLVPHADIFVHVDDIWSSDYVYNPAYEMWGKDSIDVHYFLLRHWSGQHGSLLFYFLPNGDSILVDEVKLNIIPGSPLKTDPVPTDVAGVYQATFYNTLVRKADIKQGDTDWELSRGIDAEDSEWIPIPHFTGYEIFTTVGTHGDFSIDMQSSTIDINKENATLTVPWGIYKGDSIIHEFALGPGMAWLYYEDTTSVSDSAHRIVQTGDILSMFACGNDLEQIDFKITVADPADDMALVFPLSYKVFPDPEDPYGVFVTPYYVTDEDPVIDTVGNVPYATRVDTLFKYLEKAPDATWEIIWVDEIARVDLKFGDILKVTAENGTTIKEYFIDVQEYSPSSNANLAAITWPDKTDYLEGWMGDTIPLFSPTKTLYTVTLPYGSTNVPSLVAIPQSINARIETQRAISLKGNISERTTVFTVYAADDTTIMKYSVLFEVEKDWNNVQKYYGHPFYSEFVTNQSSWLGFVEIVNPRNIPLDLSEYLFVRSVSINPAEGLNALVPAIPTAADFKYRYRSYVPGYKFYEDTVNWLLNPGILQLDQDVDPVLEPGDVFVISSANQGRSQYITDAQWEIIDKIWIAPTGSNMDPLGVQVNESFAQIKRTANAMFIFKILNDSIWEGTKPVGDPDDYELVDAFGDLTPDVNWVIGGISIAQQKPANIARKSYVYKGVLEVGEGIGNTPDSSDWIVRRNPEDVASAFDLSTNIGDHVMEIITVYISTVSSTDYLVSDGYLSPQSIQGNLTATTVSQFLEKIGVADTGQSLTVISGTDGLAKSSGDNIAGNDTLVSVSADKANTTKYVLINLPLDNDAMLKTVNTSSKFSIVVDGENGTITGVEYGMLLSELVDSLLVPELATMHIINQYGDLVPLKLLNYDTVYVDTRVGDSIYLEVIAQDGVTKITYKLDPAALSSDAFVISSVYAVDQQKKTISDLADGTTVLLFFKNIEVVKGATATLVDKAGFLRTIGYLSYDDKLIVLSEDQSAKAIYYLNFLEELAFDYNEAPMVTVAFADTSLTEGETISVTATVLDDGLPYAGTLTYTWSILGETEGVTISNPNQLTTDVLFAVPGERELQLLVYDGELGTTDNITITVNEIGSTEGITEPHLRIYPNPVSGVLTLELANVNELSTRVKIFDITGKAIFNGRFAEERINLNVSSYEDGLYLLEVETDGYKFTRKFNVLK